MDSWVHWVLGLLVAGLLAVAWPGIVHQACSDEGDGWSGACPGCESWEAENSLPPTYAE